MFGVVFVLSSIPLHVSSGIYASKESLIYLMHRIGGPEADVSRNSFAYHTHVLFVSCHNVVVNALPTNPEHRPSLMLSSVSKLFAAYCRLIKNELETQLSDFV